MKRAKLALAAALIAVIGFAAPADADSRFASGIKIGGAQIDETLLQPVYYGYRSRGYRGRYGGYGRHYGYGRGYGYRRSYRGYSRGHRGYYGGYGRGYRNYYSGYGRGYRGYYGGYGRH